MARGAVGSALFMESTSCSAKSDICVVEARLPEVGQPASSSYEGEGYIIVRDPDTEVVTDALQRIINRVRVELVEAQ